MLQTTIAAHAQLGLVRGGRIVSLHPASEVLRPGVELGFAGEVMTDDGHLLWRFVVDGELYVVSHDDCETVEADEAKRS